MAVGTKKLLCHLVMMKTHVYYFVKQILFHIKMCCLVI